jgi:tetratricopeptide (TPR) repeat protein
LNHISFAVHTIIWKGELGINFRIVIAILAVALFIGIFTYDVIIPSLKVDLSPNDADYYYNLGCTYFDSGKHREAIEVFKKAIIINPDHVDAYNDLGNAYWNVGKYQEALDAYEKAVKIEPYDAYYINNLAWLLSTCPDDDIRDGKRALDIMKPLIDRGEQDPLKIDTLAAAYAEVGNFSEAIKLMHKAIEKIDKNNKPELYKEFQLRLKSFENEQPWREKTIILHPS